MYAIQARINDKLNRMKNKNSFLSDNDLMDVTGYFILLQVLKDKLDSKISTSMEWDIKNEDNE